MIVRSAFIAAALLLSGCASASGGLAARSDDELLAMRRVVVISGPPPADLPALRLQPDLAAVASWAVARPDVEALSDAAADTFAAALRRHGFKDLVLLEDDVERAGPVTVARVVPWAEHEGARDPARDAGVDAYVWVVMGREGAEGGPHVELRRGVWLTAARYDGLPENAYLQGVRSWLGSSRVDFEGGEGVVLSPDERRAMRAAFEELLAEVGPGPSPRLDVLRQAISALLDGGRLTPEARERIVRGLEADLSQPAPRLER